MIYGCHPNTKKVLVDKDNIRRRAMLELWLDAISLNDLQPLLEVCGLESVSILPTFLTFTADMLYSFH